jgi:precorrin-2 dehydrogenase/sirohydrochlorin ferrochelatase
MLRPVSLAAILDLHGAPALVVGGGAVGLRRARTLLEAGLRVTVVAPEPHADFAGVPVQVERRPYAPDDVRGMRVVVVATDNAEVNDSVTADARAEGALVNHAGDAARGDLRFPAVIRRGAVQVAVSTGRELPMLAQALGERIAALLPDDAAIDAWAERRGAALALAPAERARALAGLRADIRAAVGLPAGGDA